MPMRGTTQRLVSLFYDETTGALTNPTSVSLTILLGSTVIATVTSGAIVHDATGTYHYDWGIPGDAAAGVYVVVWDSVMPGDTAHAFGYESVDVTTNGLAASSGCDWPLDPGCLGDTWDEYSTEVKHRAVSLASATLSRLTGYRVGECAITVRPYVQSGSCWLPSATGWMRPGLTVAGAWVNNACALGSSGREVKLPAPVGRVDEVKVDGSVLNEDDYEVHNGHILVYTGADEDFVWPISQNVTIADTEPDTFSVTYLNAYPVDANGAYAAGLLAAEFAKACATGKCRLPSNVSAVVRSGVSYELITGAFPDGKTNIREVDAFVELWNPKNRQPGTVIDPGATKYRVVTG